MVSQSTPDTGIVKTHVVGVLCGHSEPDYLDSSLSPTIYELCDSGHFP